MKAWLRVMVVVQVSLLRWLKFGRSGCRLGRARVWLYRIVLPSEESAKVKEQVDGNVKGVRIIDDKIYGRWKTLRFEFYNTMKNIAIPIERGLRLIHDEYREDLEAYLRSVRAELKKIEKEIWSRMPPELVEKYWSRESLHPARNFRWVSIPIEICREDFQRLLQALQNNSGEEEGGKE